MDKTKDKKNFSHPWAVISMKCNMAALSKIVFFNC